MVSEEYRKLCMCGDKIKHKTRLGAKKMKAILNRKYPNDPVIEYRCPYCKFFHVGRRHK